MYNNYNAAQPAFTANFVSNGIKLNPKKLEAVQEKFSKLTQQYKNDTLTVSPKVILGTKEDGDAGRSFHIADFMVGDENPASIIYLRDFKEWFNIGSVDEIAKSLTRIFKSGKFNSKQQPKVSGMKKELEHVQKSAASNLKKAEVTQKPIYQVLADKNNARAESLKKEIRSTEDYNSEIIDRIQDYPIDAPIQWWHL